MPVAKLTDAKIRSAKPSDKPVRLSDGGGLYLEVSPAGGRLWRWKFRFGAKEKRLSLGQYPEVSLKAARELHEKNRALLASGVDPSAAKQAQKASRAQEITDSFEAVAREWHQTVHVRKVSTAHAARTLVRLEQDIFPWIGSTRIGELKAQILLKTLRRIEARGAIETAHRAKQACSQVFRYAIATGRAETDPAGSLSEALKPVLVQHMPAITDPKRVGELLRAIHSYEGLPVTRAALQLAPLVFVRPGELRQAEWSEIDLEAAEWHIASGRMKRSKQEKATGDDHFVPLSRQALEILQDLHPLTGHGRYVFPSLRTGERPMSDNAVLSALRRMGFPKDEMTGHGFRAMARTMLAERVGVEESVIEAQLAHAVKNSLGRAYDRTKFIAQRREMLQTWADYLDKLRLGADVYALRAA